jgi:hypothetical protein
MVGFLPSRSSKAKIDIRRKEKQNGRKLVIWKIEIGNRN